MFFPSSRFENICDLRNRQVTLFFAIVKMRRQPDASFGTVIHENLSRQQLAAHLGGVRAVYGDGARALPRTFWRVYAPSMRLRGLEQTRGHAHGFLANRANPGFVQYVEPRLARIERGNVRRAIQIAEGILAGVDGASLKRKGALVRKPARDCGLQFRAQIFPHVKITDARPAAQPFEHTTTSKIGTETTHINRNRPGSLEEIEDDVRPNAMRLLDDRSSIHYVSASEQHVRDRHEQRCFINGVKKFAKVESHRISTRNEVDSCAVTALLMVEILNRRKLQVRQHYLVPRPTKIKTRADYRLNQGHILMQRNFAPARSNQRSDLVAHVDGHLPPAFLPRAHPALAPRIGVRPHFVVHAARHGPQRIADHIGRTFKDREFAAPLQQFIHLAKLHWKIPGNGP